MYVVSVKYGKLFTAKVSISCKKLTPQKVPNTASGYQFSRTPYPPSPLKKNPKKTVFFFIPSINHFNSFITILLVKLRYLFLLFYLVKAQIYFAESSSSYTFLPFKIIIFAFHLFLSCKNFTMSSCIPSLYLSLRQVCGLFLFCGKNIV